MVAPGVAALLVRPAPRADGLLSFHVKAVPAGWVSNALVRHARPGDVLRLGPPTGSMVVDHTTDNGMLCLGGGTGIAPIKALIEDVAVHGERRPVEVFFGARSDGDLYDKDTLLGLQRSHPWLSVRPVVGEGLAGQLPQAIGAHGPWSSYDAFVSGPPAMIRSGVSELKRIGIPGDRIRFDAVEELVGAGAETRATCRGPGRSDPGRTDRRPGRDQPRSGACMARTPSMLPSR